MENNRFLMAALRYAQELDWYVLPVQPGGKRPLTRRGVKDASNDVDQIRNWWGKWPDANIGVACGPSGLLVIDVDMPGGDIELDALLDKHGPLPETVIQLTPGGGTHYIFKAQPGRSYPGKLGKKIDLLSGNKYFLVSPSVHKSGKYYGFEASSEPIGGIDGLH